MGRSGKRKRRSEAALASNQDRAEYPVTKQPSSPRHLDQTVSLEDTSPQLFWERYVARRQPVVVAGQPDVLRKAAEHWSDDSYLVQAAGSAQVAVERRSHAQEGFGKGRKINMPLEQFLRAGNSNLYLTTQAVGVDADGHPELYTAPITHLIQDIPLRPALMGQLVPQQINMWMGHAHEGASSGLHHDFHDNLYILMRGRKRFRLFPPQLAPRMYTHGEVQKVHANGRIVYKGMGAVLSDGSDANDVEAWRRRKAAESALAAEQAAVERGDMGSKRRLAQAEARLEAALDLALDSFDAFGDGELDDDFEGLSDDDDVGSRDGQLSSRARSGAAAKAEPASFSRVDLSLPDSALRAKFPLFPGKKAAVECELHAGQMLYLPCGWFHEVTSFAGPGGSSHLALNYWFHPPDHLQQGRAGSLKPYTSDFWPDLWRERMARQQGQDSHEAQAVAPDGQLPQAENGHAVYDATRASPSADQQDQGTAGCCPGPDAADGASDPVADDVASSPESSEGGHSRAALYHHTPLCFGYGRRQHLQQFVGYRSPHASLCFGSKLVQAD